MQIYRASLFVIACLTIALDSFTQNLQVITLDLAEGTGGITITGNTRKPHPGRFPRLELMSRKPVVFKIININPLRYNIFLNDDLVTNFFDGNTSAVSNGITVNGANIIKEIAAINIFTFDAVPEINIEDKLAIREVRKEIESIKTTYYSLLDTFERIDREILALPGYSNYYSRIGRVSPEEEKQIIKKLNQYDKVFSDLEAIEKKLGRKVSDLQVMLNSSNDKDIRILTEQQDSTMYLSDTSPLKETFKRSQTQIKRLKLDLLKLDSIINIVQKLDIIPKNVRRIQSYSYGNRRDSVYDDNIIYEKILLRLLEEYKYMHEKLRNIRMGYRLGTETGFSFIEEKLKIIEFAFDKRNKAIETCILNNSLEVGKLLEEKWTEYSRERNKYLNKPSITQGDLVEIDRLRKEITVVFTYVKNWIADFALLNQSAKLDNKIFKSVHENIAVNCKKFLDFLRDLDHLNAPNTIEYTSPIYDNLKNIDLIRFKVDKQDRHTPARQTYEYDTWIKGGIKIDFSVGFFASGLTDRQYNKIPYYIPKVDSTEVGGNKVYTHSTIANTDSFYISESKNGNFSFCFGGMVNLIPRNGAKWLNIGGSLGLAYSTNQKLQALAGISLHFGKTERLILHAGVAFGTIKELDQARLTLLQSGSAKTPEKSYFVRGNVNDFTIPEIERFAVKPFFGLSYNLSKQHSLQAVKSQPGQQFFKGELQ